jgi:hypothetical protein
MSGPVEFRLDTSGFIRDLSLYAAQSSRDLPAIQNKAGLNIAIKALRWTKKADKKKLEGELKYTGRDFRSRTLKSGQTKIRLVKARRFTRRAWGQTAKKLGRKPTVTEVAKFVGQTLGACGYTRWGWGNAIFHFGGRPPHDDFRILHAYGGAAKAHPQNLVTEFWNSAETLKAAPVRSFAGHALQIAMDQESQWLREAVLKRLKNQKTK